MEQLSLEMLMFVLAGGFFAAYVDAVVGGGGLIAVPVLLATGMPPALVLGTNKLAGTMGSLTSTISFIRSGHVELKTGLRLFPLSLIGAVAGTFVLQQIPSDFLRPLVVFMLIGITVYTIFRRSWGSRSSFAGFTRKSAVLIGAAALALGFYDGFFGPGTGSFLLFAFLLLGFDFVRAAGNAKVLNFGSNLASLATFIALGSVHYGIGLSMGAAMILGSWLGSRMAIRKGSVYVRPLFLTVCALLIGKQLWELFQSFVGP
ncbi:TSUP family transporter [Paenibacillus thailandensis]|uniref:Probable membrane transporter protein n=1 Tax=Paenibacillus thailandensis TaxID=393250 RepID=A0ABW5R4C2_9BACL